MPKLKTHRGAAKRFKKTGTGKFVRSKAFKQHIPTSKSRSRKRGLKGTVVVSAADRGETSGKCCRIRGWISAELRLRLLLVRMCC